MSYVCIHKESDFVAEGNHTMFLRRRVECRVQNTGSSGNCCWFVVKLMSLLLCQPRSMNETRDMIPVHTPSSTMLIALY